jgi:signal transduction histidine kinase
MPLGDAVEDRAGPRQQRLVLGLSAALLASLGLMLPHAALPLTPLTHISGMYGAATAMIDLATFWLLASSPTRHRSHTLIAAAYLFGGLMAVLHVLTFPGAVLSEGPVIGSPHAVSLLFILWRAGFAAFILWAVLAARQPPRAAPGGRSAAPLWAAVLAVAAAFTVSQLSNAAAVLSVGGREMFGAVSVVGSYASAVLAVVATLAILQARLFERTLFAWLVFVLVAEAAGVWFSTFSGGRYTLAWYAARVEGLAANTVVLILLARHFRGLQMRLRETVSVLQLRTEGLQAEIHRRESAEVELAHAKKLEAVGQLGAGLAHDLNNILQVVTARLLILQRRAGSVVDADVEVIRRNVRKADALTRQLTLVSGRRSHQASPLDLGAALPTLTEGLKALLGAQHTLQVDIPAGLPPIAVDALELEIALTNLVTNARDAMPEGGRLEIAATLRPGASERVDLQVRDSGSGMSPELLERAFEPFFTTKDFGKGTGLGLPQVRGFVSASGGSVSVESQPGRGTVVTMTFPVKAPQRPAPAIALPATVLLVDDNDDVREASAQLLAAAGCIVRQTASAAEALALLAGDFAPDLLITDIVMPGELDGLALAQRARALRPALAIVLVTGYSDAVASARTHGLPVVRKPYDLAALHKALA